MPESDAISIAPILAAILCWIGFCLLNEQILSSFRATGLIGFAVGGWAVLWYLASVYLGPQIIVWSASLAMSGPWAAVFVNGLCVLAAWVVITLVFWVLVRLLGISRGHLSVSMGFVWCLGLVLPFAGHLGGLSFQAIVFFSAFALLLIAMIWGAGRRKRGLA